MDKHFSIVLPLKKRDHIDPGDLVTDLRLLVEQTGATVTVDPRSIHAQTAARPGLFSFKKAEPAIFAFELDGVRLRVAAHPDPFAAKLDMGKFVNPVMWEYGLGEFTDHRAHVRIYEAGIEGEEGPDATFDRAAAVTITASVVAKLTEPVGAIWVAANNSLPMRGFAQAVEQLKGGSAPLDFWMRWHVVAPGEMQDANSGLITGGLYPFFGHELLAKPSTVETKTMINHAFALAQRMLDEQMTMEDGDVVKGHEAAELRVRTGRRYRGAVSVTEISMVHKPRAVPDPVVKAPPRPEFLVPPPEAPADAAIRRLPTLEEIAAMGDSIMGLQQPKRVAVNGDGFDSTNPRNGDPADPANRRTLRVISNNLPQID